MDLKYCERCGKWYAEEDYEVGDYILFKATMVTEQGVSVEDVGICPECEASLKEWLAAGKEE